MPVFPVAQEEAVELSRSALASVREQLRELRRGRELELYERVDLRAWTVLRMGGLADILLRCKTVAASQHTVDLLTSHGLPWLTLGAGTRVVPPERGLRVPVLCLGGELAASEVDAEGIVAGAGSNLTQVCRAAARAGLAGMERFFGTQGSLGGTIVTGLGRRRSKLHDLLDWIELVRPGRPPERLSPEQWTESIGETGHGARQVVVRARFALISDGLAAINARLGRAARIRQRPPGSLEPVFFDPTGVAAEELLREAGCCTLSAGGARVCDRHPNRILASPRTSPDDVLQLCGMMRDRVQDRFGVRLEPAARLVDEYGRMISP